MAFLIGIIILISFFIFAYIFIKIKIKNILRETGFSEVNIKNIVESARMEDQEVPKSLASMDRIYLDQIKKDFINININELKRKAENTIFDCYMAINDKDISKFKGNKQRFVKALINDFSKIDAKIRDFRFHNTVVSKYEKEKGIATIYFSSSFQYFLEGINVNKKVQDRARVEFIYVIDASKVSCCKKVLGINCPNCGSPLTSLGEKKCSYCGTVSLEIIGKVFTCNDIVRY